MDELLKNISSPSWWIGIVFISIMLNLVSAYLKTPLDHALSATSSWWARRSQKEKARHEKTIELLANDPHKQILLLAKENRCRHKAVINLLIAVMSYVAYEASRILPDPASQSSLFSWVTHTGPVVFVFLFISSMQEIIEARKYSQLIADAQIVEANKKSPEV